MRQVAILTDFHNYDAAYSLCQVVRCQLKALHGLGYRPRLIVQEDFSDRGELSAWADVQRIQLHTSGDNRVHVTRDADMQITAVQQNLREALDGCNVVLAHDVIYQANMWMLNVAARRLAKVTPGLRWLHWVHSATNLDISAQTGRFQAELSERFPHSTLVVMHPEEFNRKGSLYGYENDQIAIIPNPLDITEYYHPAAQQLIEAADLMLSDCILVYPCRLDRGKQPHILIEIAAEMVKLGYNPRVVILDFHSISGDKADYRAEMKVQAQAAGVKCFFGSDLPGAEPGYPHTYMLPHQAALNLLDMADVLVHPSVSESDPLILAEAMWARAGLLLNFDLPVFRQHDGHALFGKFSSAIDVTTGQPGTTTTNYTNRTEYMRGMAGAILYQLEHNPVANRRLWVRKTKSIQAVGRLLWQAIENP